MKKMPSNSSDTIGYRNKPEVGVLYTAENWAFNACNRNIPDILGICRQSAVCIRNYTFVRDAAWPLQAGVTASTKHHTSSGGLIWR